MTIKNIYNLEKDQNLVALDNTLHQVYSAKLPSFELGLTEKESIIIIKHC